MRLLTLLAAAQLACAAANAATLKPFGTLAHSVVRLSDLWDGVTRDMPLGPAPAPGGSITVPAAQLVAIARQFGVDWQPNGTGERVVLERPGRALTRDDVKPAIWEGLRRAGAADDADLELSAFTSAPVAADGKLDVSVAQMDLDAVTGRFAALLDIQADDAPVTQLRVTGRVQAMIDLPVPRRRILPGEILAPADLEWSRLRVGVARGEIIHAPAEAVGLSAKHVLSPGQPIASADLGRPLVVGKGETVILSLESAGLSLTARGLAMEPGSVGERIHVLNENAHMAVEADVTGPGAARVVPNTARHSDRYVYAR